MQATQPTPCNNPRKPLRIGITGGIGSGKSIVSRILRTCGFPVYDTDSEARRLMNRPHVQQQIAATWGNHLYDTQGNLDRRALAAIVFGNDAALAQLNAIVHPAVRADFDHWAQSRTEAAVFVESAILQSAHMDTGLDYVWVVDAPTETRIARVMARNAMSRDEVTARIAAQPSYVADDRTRIIVNDDILAVLPQVASLLTAAGIAR